ncbi:MAG TPA: YIP1 family protein [Actinomycetota bacterium]|nr:YIP1 family protein [Actinomycetota bacterium]
MSSAVSSRHGSARLGATVRGVLVSPGSAFVPALRRVEASEEGTSTFVLAALGGAAGMLLWLKARALVGFRPLSPSDFHWGYFVTSLLFAAIVALLAQVAWSFAAPRAGGPDAGSPRSFRAVWALSAFPQLPALLLLLPLDLLLVGDKAFTATDGGDTVALAWMALSTALAVSVGAWSLYVFVRGTHVATRATPVRSAGVVALSLVAVAVVVALFAGALVGLREVLS